MGEAVVVPPGGGEVVGDSPDRRVEILCDDPALNATWSRFGPRREGADLHVHRRHTDLFYVLAGELTVRLGPAGDEVAVPAGTLVRVPPLVVHGFRNGTGEELRYLNFHAPGQGFADYMRALRDGRRLAYDQEEPPEDGGRPPSEAVIGGAEPVRDGVTLLADAGDIGIAEVRRPDAGPVESRGGWVYVLEGELTVTADGRESRAPAGAWLHSPAGVPQAVSAPGPVRYLELHAPGGGFGARLRG